MKRALTQPASGSRLRSVAETIGVTALIQLSGLVTGALVARMLGVENRGLLAAVTVWTAAVAALGDLGGPIAYAYQAAQPHADRRMLVRNAVSLSGLQGFVLILVGVPLVAAVVEDYPELLPAAIGFVVCFMPLNLFTRYVQAVHQGELNFRRFNQVRYCLTISYLVLIVTIKIAGIDSVASVLAAMIASNIVAAFIAARGLSVLSSLRSRFDRHTARATFSYGLRAHIGNLTPIDSMQLDLAVVVVLLGPREAGLYAVGAAAATVIRSQGTAIGYVALPSVAGETTDERRLDAIGLFFRATMYAGLVLGGAIFLLAELLVPLIYGTEFEEAVQIVRILVLGIVAASLRQVLGDCLRGAGWPLHGTMAEVASWVVALVGLVTLVPALGAPGAAIAVCVSYFASLALMLVLASRRGLRASEIVRPRRSDVAVVARLVARRGEVSN